MRLAAQPLLGFMLIGASKSGTTALADFLSQHPEICMASRKEVHLFDTTRYSKEWTPEQVDAHYRPFFAHCDGETILGEATPSYLYLPEIAHELHRYNPALKLLVLLRDPVERAISHYYMKKLKHGQEPDPLWLALLKQPFLARTGKDEAERLKARRRFSYRKRGLYSRQLLNIYRYFDKNQVLIIHSWKLLHHHDDELRRVFAFLGVSTDVRVVPQVLNASGRQRRHLFVSAVLRLSYMAERHRLRRILADPEPSLVGPRRKSPKRPPRDSLMGGA